MAQRKHTRERWTRFHRRVFVKASDGCTPQAVLQHRCRCITTIVHQQRLHVRQRHQRSEGFCRLIDVRQLELCHLWIYVMNWAWRSTWQRACWHAPWLWTAVGARSRFAISGSSRSWLRKRCSAHVRCSVWAYRRSLKHLNRVVELSRRCPHSFCSFSIDKRSRNTFAADRQRRTKRGRSLFSRPNFPNGKTEKHDPKDW